MLDKLRAEALALIAATAQCTMSTMGPAGVQATVVACLVRNDAIYVLVSSTSDQLFNIEHHSEVVLTTPLWHLRGAAHALAEVEGQYGLVPRDLAWSANDQGYRIVTIWPLRMHIESGGNRCYPETIDFELPRRRGQPIRRATNQLARDSEDSVN